ncbi:hypothetical protein M8C21_026168 [Ambrosia artemisiifolia]|uniref:Uncharacterized protein n=1 Tax=Ambrosia artemisiifolia TaxID=4212 RepID=A0AAD5BW54_AMBAR|nr:hypothetical protein M8C21_026168 [Ambrosia artemisiifolia]
MGDWEKAQEFINKDSDALTDKINSSGSTALHVAIGNPQNNFILEKLLLQINPELLPTLVNNRKQNPLHYAAILGNTIAAEKLVEKNPQLLFIVDYENDLPIERAIYGSHKTTFLYLLQACKQHIGLSQIDGYHNPFEGEHGVQLLSSSIAVGFLDIAYDILKEYPVLARTHVTNVRPALHSIAKLRDAYPSAKRYNFYQKFVYSHVPAENQSLDDIYDIENQKSYKAKLVTKSCIYRGL